MEERKTPIPAFEDAQLDGDSQNDFRRGLGGAEGLIKTQNRANVVVFAARERSIRSELLGARASEFTPYLSTCNQ